MNDRIKDIITVALFGITVIGIFIVSIIKSPTEISISERRLLAQFPEITWDSITKKKIKPTDKDTFMESFEKYALDQFIARDTFRGIKARVLFNVYNQKDNNNIYLVNGQVSKPYNNLNKVSIVDAARKFNKLYDQYLSEMNVYYSIIPDKNYFLAEKNGYPAVDYKAFESYLVSNMKDKMKYISIFDVLNVDDYYATDIHWRQEKIAKVVNKLGQKMGFESGVDYETNSKYPFYGVYYGQSALPIEGEELIYLTNKMLENVKVYELNEKTLKMEESQIYDEKDFENVDPYDIFLGGPRPLFVIENEAAKTDKELILFRDSFGSSLAPLLVENYKKITIIDLRYIGSPLLKDYVEFEAGSDTLIIYCTDVLNSSSTIKVL